MLISLFPADHGDVNNYDDASCDACGDRMLIISARKSRPKAIS